MIENQPNELTLIYHSDKSEDKKARAYIESITKYKVKTLDLKNEPITEMQLAEIANKMNVEIKLIFDTTYMDRLKTPNTKAIDEFDDNDILTILVNEPILLKTPIAIIGKQAFVYTSANDMLLKNASADGPKGSYNVSKV